MKIADAEPQVYEKARDVGEFGGCGDDEKQQAFTAQSDNIRSGRRSATSFGRQHSAGRRSIQKSGTAEAQQQYTDDATMIAYRARPTTTATELKYKAPERTPGVGR